MVRDGDFGKQVRAKDTVSREVAKIAKKVRTIKPCLTQSRKVAKKVKPRLLTFAPLRLE